MASLQIAMNQSARVGDRVVYKGELCYVERINMTFIQLRDWDDTRLIVPVTEFAYETFSNWTIQDPAMKRILKFKLTPQTDVAAVRERFMDIMGDLAADDEMGPMIGDMDEAKVDVVDQDVFGIDVWAFVPCVSPNTSWAVACEVRERLIAALRDLRDDEGRPIFPEPAAAEAA
jgi:small-conductance mechanosensitive channel